MKSCLVICFLLLASQGHAQHDHASKAADEKWPHIPIFTQAFSDSSFKGKEIMVVDFTVPPGAVDPIPHQHDCQLIGYVVEGEVITKLKDKAPQHFRKGEVFYEFPNEIHERIENPDKKASARIILYYLYNKGAVLYKKL